MVDSRHGKNQENIHIQKYQLIEIDPKVIKLL
jgi:hypothetical protein